MAEEQIARLRPEWRKARGLDGEEAEENGRLTLAGKGKKAGETAESTRSKAPKADQSLLDGKASVQ